MRPIGPPASVRTPPAPSLDDTELLAAIGRGDASAATSLYVRARSQVDRTIVQLIRANDADHDDLAQLSFLALVDSLERYRGECSLDGWISRVTAHTVYKELRRRKSGLRVKTDARGLALVHPPPSQDVERELSLRGSIGRVKAHLDALDPVKAWTLLLHDVCGYDLQEISEITEVSVAAAQSRLVRGRAELHARIEADPELAEALVVRRKVEREGPR